MTSVCFMWSPRNDSHQIEEPSRCLGQHMLPPQPALSPAHYNVCTTPVHSDNCYPAWHHGIKLGPWKIQVTFRVEFALSFHEAERQVIDWLTEWNVTYVFDSHLFLLLYKNCYFTPASLPVEYSSYTTHLHVCIDNAASVILQNLPHISRTLAAICSGHAALLVQQNPGCTISPYIWYLATLSIPGPSCSASDKPIWWKNTARMAESSSSWRP